MDVDEKVIGPDTTRAEIEEALGHAVRDAIRQPHVLGTKDYPSRWDKRHAFLDALLDFWQLAD